MAAISSGTASVPESGSGWPAPLDRMLKKDLAGLDDRALLSIARLLPQARERRVAACEPTRTGVHAGPRRSGSGTPAASGPCVCDQR